MTPTAPRAALLLLALLAGACHAPLVAAASPKISELYMPPGRGCDWSKAGYRGGAPFPSPPVKFNVRDFGAKGDGSSDDTNAVLAAVKAADNPTSGGGVVYFPAGTYSLRQPLTITRKSVVLRGDGPSRTKLYFPISLSEIFEGTWSMGPNGKIRSQWAFGGAFINFRSRKQRSTDSDTLLGSVKAPVEAGARRIPINAKAEIQKGWYVKLFINDASTSGTQRALLADAATPIAVAPEVPVAPAPPAPVPANLKLIGRNVSSRFEDHPAFLAALEGAATMGEDGEGLTPQQAAAADASWASFHPAGAGVGAAARPGTFVYWIYGNGLSDSGGDVGVVNGDEVTFTAKVKAVGPGWIDIDRELPFPVAAGWQGSVHRDKPALEDVGIEKLTIEFKHSYAGVHWSDRGYNALQVTGAANFFLNQVKVMNADNGIFMAHTDRSTVRDFVVDVTKPRLTDPKGFNGHHAISISQGSSNRVERFAVWSKYIHDVTVSEGASLNVFRNGRGTDMNMDHHRGGPFANLFTDIDVGLGTRPFNSGGQKDRGANSGRGTTFWGIRASDGNGKSSGSFSPETKSPTESPKGATPAASPAPKPSPKPSAKPSPPPSPKPKSPSPGAAPSGTKRKPSPPPPPPHKKKSRSPPPPPPKKKMKSPPPPPPKKKKRSPPPPPPKKKNKSTKKAPPPPKKRSSGRRLQSDPGLMAAVAPSTRQLALPPCTWGPWLNFYGPFTGFPCPEMSWLVQPLGPTSPPDLFEAQQAARQDLEAAGKL